MWSHAGSIVESSPAATSRLTVVLLQKFAEAAAKLIPQWEIIDYAHDDKVDAPSGTARELAARLSKVRHPEPTVPVDQTVGPREARGATLSGSQVHSDSSARLRDQRRDHLRNAGSKADNPSRLRSSARPYVDGALLAIRKVSTLVGVHRGLDSVLDL